VGKISDAVTSMVITAQTKNNIISTDTNKFYDAYQTWESASATIASRIRAYFYNSPMTQQWNNYSKIVNDFALLSISKDTCKKLGYVHHIQKYHSITLFVPNSTDLNKCPANPDEFLIIQRSPLISNLDGINWNELVVHGNDTILSTSWLKLKQSILNQKDNLIQQILKSHISEFA
jgi:hypothetical protein